MPRVPAAAGARRFAAWESYAHPRRPAVGTPLLPGCGPAPLGPFSRRRRSVLSALDQWQVPEIHLRIRGPASPPSLPSARTHGTCALFPRKPFRLCASPVSARQKGSQHRLGSAPCHRPPPQRSGSQFCEGPCSGSADTNQGGLLPAP